MSCFDALVIGGGVVGMSTAYHLVRLGAKTMLIDRRDEGRATDAGAGILAADTYGGDSEDWFNLGIEASAYYPQLIAELEREQDGETGYSRCGKLTLAVSPEEIEPFEQSKRRIFARQQRRAFPASKDLYEISPGDARRLFPPLARVHRALYYDKAARVDGRLLSDALLRAARQGGLHVKRASVDQLLLSGNSVGGVVANGKTFAAAHVAIAGGAWSPSLGAPLGVQIPVAPQRGQIIHLNLPDLDTAAWPIVNAFREHYMVPWPDHRLVVGATRESGVEFKAHTTVAGVREVLDEALRVAPGLEGARMGEIRVGLRPATPDQLPVLGPVPGWKNIFLATGHGASGLQLGPFSGKIIAEIMLDLAPPGKIAAFNIARFIN